MHIFDSPQREINTSFSYENITEESHKYFHRHWRRHCHVVGPTHSGLLVRVWTSSKAAKGNVLLQVVAAPARALHIPRLRVGTADQYKNEGFERPA